MNQSEFAKHLVRLSRHQVGVMEAAALFSIAGPTPTSALAGLIESTHVVARARLSVLRMKKLVVTTYDPDGTVVNRLSARGQIIVDAILKPAKP